MSSTGPTPDAGVRAARPSDADAIGAVHARAWAAAYPALVADQPEATTAHSLAASWHDALTGPQDGHRLLVATAGADLVGFAASTRAADPAVDELLVLLVDPDAQRRGHGSRLLNATADQARDAGRTSLQAWVPQDDAPGQGFLAAAGLAPDGATRLLDSGQRTVREVRYRAGLA